MINLLRQLKHSCDALDDADEAAAYFILWPVSESVTVVIRWVLATRSDTPALAAQPKIKHNIGALLERVLDEKVLSDQLQEQQFYKKHAGVTESQLDDRIVTVSAAIGALLDKKELQAVLVPRFLESFLASARKYKTAGRSLTMRKAYRDLEGTT